MPSIKDLVYLSANTYTKAEILEMEGLIIETISFSVQKTSVLAYLPFFVKAARLDARDSFLAQYVCELSLL